MKRIVHSDYLVQLKAKHGNRIKPLADYVNCRIVIPHKCTVCKTIWNSAPTHVLNSKVGCPKCGWAQALQNKTKTTEYYANECDQLFKGLKPLEAYRGDGVKIAHQCPTCEGTFIRKPNTVLNGWTTCIRCSRAENARLPGSRGNHSNIAIQWLEQRSKLERRKIQHAMNGGEKRVTLNSGKVICVDGYNVRSNTVYEFHGDCFHGNPERYKPKSTPNPFSKLTAATLYKRTLAREKEILESGYNLVVIWEDEYKRKGML